MADDETLSGAQEDDLLRQRRNLLAAVVALWFLVATGAELTQITLFGNKIELEDPIAPANWVFALVLYFYVRYGLHMNHYRSLGVMRAYRGVRERRFKAAVLDHLTAQGYFERFDTQLQYQLHVNKGHDPRPLKQEEFEVGLREGWAEQAASPHSDLTVTLQMPQDPAVGASETVPARDSARLFRVTALWSALRTPLSIDFLLPLTAGFISIGGYPLYVAWCAWRAPLIERLTALRDLMGDALLGGF